MVTFSEAQLMAWVAPIFWPFLRVLGVYKASPSRAEIARRLGSA